MSKKENTPEIIFQAAKTAHEFEQILSLQRNNHITALTETHQENQGFLFAQHTLELLQKMAVMEPQVIALHEDRVIGYNLAMPLAFRNKIPSLIPMFDEFDKVSYQGRPLNTYRYIVGGQVCVSIEYRGLGLLDKLYTETRGLVQDRYELCVTEIASRNSVSMKSHLKAGFVLAATYHDGSQQWNIVIQDFRQNTT
ncbi:GNAT family N-acetyltransferase [Pedobacter sp. KBW06]|uniref:GNAT family N-acetyltransferase n=1 Tax=Pedobacter sp. KBW06 TaxID=2153359 RepID=UPI000F5A0D97|nr:GNAT family N-acetyltransferase [Pedobacter sp. KBW06]RQO64916.1 GNAT family N-acetyltransferase [Pedobacter sp. KBW06]